MRGYALIPVLVVALSMILSAGCFGGHDQSNDCTLSVNVQVTNNPGDLHLFTYKIDLLTFTNTSERDYVCDRSHDVCDHQTTICDHTTCDRSHKETVCDQTCTHQYCKADGSTGTRNNHVYNLGDCTTSHKVTVCDHTFCDTSHTVCDSSHTVCDSGHYETVWTNTTTVTNTQTVTSVQGSPTSVQIVYVTSEGRYHLRWHDHFGDHDNPCGDIDTTKTYYVRISDVSLDPAYGQGQTQVYDLSICGGSVTFSYNGPNAGGCPAVPCTGDQVCVEGSCVEPSPGGTGLGAGAGSGGGDSTDGSGFIFWDNTLCLVNTFQHYQFSASNQTHIYIEIDDPAGDTVYYGETTGVNYTYGHKHNTLGNGTYYVWDTGYWTVKLLGTDAVDNPVTPRVLGADKLWVSLPGPNGQPVAPVERVKNYIRIT